MPLAVRVLPSGGSHVSVAIDDGDGDEDKEQGGEGAHLANQYCVIYVEIRRWLWASGFGLRASGFGLRFEYFCARRKKSSEDFGGSEASSCLAKTWETCHTGLFLL